MTASLTIDGTQDVAEALRKYGALAEAEIAKAVTATALLVNSDIKKRIQRGPKTGRKYDQIFRTINGRAVPVGPRAGNNLSATHQASAPGESPATDTGVLVNSIAFKQVSKLTAEVESRLAYATYLEFGTRAMAARPAWLPAIEKMRPEFAKRVADAIRKAAP
jgi:hypothetical protein